MEKILKDENVTLYVWANLKKNPRYPSPYHFLVDAQARGIEWVGLKLKQQFLQGALYPSV